MAKKTSSALLRGIRTFESYAGFGRRCCIFNVLFPFSSFFQNKNMKSEIWNDEFFLLDVRNIDFKRVIQSAKWIQRYQWKKTPGHTDPCVLQRGSLFMACAFPSDDYYYFLIRPSRLPWNENESSKNWFSSDGLAYSIGVESANAGMRLKGTVENGPQQIYLWDRGGLRANRRRASVPKALLPRFHPQAFSSLVSFFWLLPVSPSLPLSFANDAQHELPVFSIFSQRPNVWKVANTEWRFFNPFPPPLVPFASRLETLEKNGENVRFSLPQTPTRKSLCPTLPIENSGRIA